MQKAKCLLSTSPAVHNLFVLLYCRAENLDHVMYRMGLLAVLRSKERKGEVIVDHSPCQVLLGLWSLNMLT